MSNKGSYCQKGTYRREKYERRCESGWEADILGICHKGCEDTYPENGHNGLTRNGIHQTCFGQCPDGHTLCTGDNALLCIEGDQAECDRYIQEVAEDVVEWTVAISTMNWFDIIDKATGDTTKIDFPVCDDWNI